MNGTAWWQWVLCTTSNGMDNNMEPKNEYFAKREDKEKAIREEKRKNMMSKTIKWIIAAILLALLCWPIYNYFHKAAQQADKPGLGDFFPAQSRDHIKSGDKHDPYNSNPPTGGWHFDTPAQTGIYDTEFPDETLIHNLEHGHVWIAYRPDLPKDQIEKLADIAKSYGSKIIMAPRKTNDTPIALVAWEHLLKMNSVDEVTVKEFMDEYRGLAGPETLPDFGFKDFRGTGISTTPPAMKK